MVFVTGGSYQGKLDFVKRTFGVRDADITDGGTCAFSDGLAKPVLNHVHVLAERMLDAGILPLDAFVEQIKQYPDRILICDEMGCGIVPLDARERSRREAVGRLQCALAERAHTVYRVCCGIPVKIKESL